MHRSFIVRILFVLAILASVPVGRAQTKKPADELRLIQRSAAMAIDSLKMMTTARLANYNQQLQIVNDMKPLEPQSLDSVTIKNNLIKIKDLIGWLKRFEDTSAQIGNSLHEIIHNLREGSEAAGKDKSLKRYEDAQTESIKADATQIDALVALYQRVSEVLQYMLTAKYEIKGQKLSFTTQQDLDQYVAVNKSIDAANGELHKATEAVNKSFDSMNKALKELVDKVNGN